jgi:hypothetical protein
MAAISEKRKFVACLPVDARIDTLLLQISTKFIAPTI